ncbi:hypothetical protein BT96DRAFT_970544 [Gymnopus androsaceus JB14]|uniref:Uncharacterized protein n=1 Tax=Gymnopus androsaceus JB14 TaxID=1447944 RepID=A0A6A4IDG8_9AGAR|nr:hypothetical protein BT96DRAFT_970544 [Gymnopus androsaceus JB14]
MPVPLRANANLRAEAKYNVVTEFPNYDLHSAAASGNQGLVEYALTRGQPVNSVLDGVLPLHAACAGGHEQVVKLLIDHGADVNAARLPRRYSNEKNRDASAPIVGTTGSTPLHFAAANGNKNVISTLLLRGAHADRRDKYGVSPAMLAEQHGWLECAQLLNNWVKDKDRDLRERGQPNNGPPSAGPSYMAHVPPGNEDDIKPSTRKHIQVKRSIDTALNMFKSGSATPQSKLAINSSSPSMNNLATFSPATSPSRLRRDLSPSPSEDGRFSPSPSPIDPGSRRPSLPQILQPPPRSGKPATLTKSPRNPRRPRSAGTDAEQQQQEPDAAVLGRGSAGRKLGTKYSLLNLFKKGNESGGVPLERTTSHQSSMSIPIMNSSSYNSSFKVASALSNSPKQTASPLNESGPLPTAGYRFGGSSNDTPLKARTASSSSHTRPSPSTSSLPRQQTYTPPPRAPVPFAVDLHNALAGHIPNNRDRSGSSGSTTRYDPPMGLGITFDEGELEEPATAAQLHRHPVRRLRPSDVGHTRDRSGSNASNRNAAIFDDEVVIAAGRNDSSGNVSVTESVTGKNSSRPSILRGHSRTYSSGQRALRFDSSTSVLSGPGVRRESDAQPPQYPLRGCISAGSLNRLHNERNGSPRLQPMTLDGEWITDRVPESAPPNLGDFDLTPADESEYGLELSPRLDVQTRNRGLSFTSSECSLSPAMDVATGTSTLNAEFPFSINAPPPPLDELETVAPVHFQVSPPPISPVDTRLRGDSVSSTSTADSGFNPSLSASATTSGSGGSGAIPTPMVSPEGSAYLNLPSTDFSRSRSHREKVNIPEVVRDDYRDGLEPAPVTRWKASMWITADSMPLSARLAALGESLELERRLREQKKAEALKVKSATTTESMEDTSSTTRTEIFRQSSLDQLSRSMPTTQDIIRRPHANSEASRMNNSVIPAFERSKPTHHPSLSASAAPRSRTPDPDNDLSRISSLEILDVDTELGPSLCRVSTAPNTSYSARDKRERELASNTKLTRMGFSPNEIGRAPPKRFGGLKSLMQSLKGGK